MFRQLIALTALTLLFLGQGISHGQPASPTAIPDCGACHVSSTPGTQDHALRACTRSLELAASEDPASSPRIVILGTLENLYVPVKFDHLLHSSMSGMGGKCQTCHHFSKTAHFTPHACKTCHPTDVVHENIAQPGLKGAYHRQCLGCHTNWDTQTSCEICHEKRQGGKLQGAAKTFAATPHYKKVELKELIKIRTEFAAKDEVPFTHKLHATQYNRECSMCHKHEQCISCHSQQKELHPFSNTTREDVHKTCNKCHGKNECTHCHGRDPKDVVFSHDRTGWPLKAFHAKLKCWQCHYQKDGFKKPQPNCSACHTPGWVPKSFTHEVTGVPLNDIHSQFTCQDCHSQGLGTPTSCTGCHDDGRKFDPSKGWDSK